MPYSSVWNATRPAGSVAAKNIDDEIRILRLQLQERLNDVLVQDMTADPLVLKDNIKGLKLGLQRLVPFSSFLNDLHARENDMTTTGQLNGFCGSGPWIASLAIPPGCVIVKVEWLVDKHDATSLAMELRHRAFTNAPAAAIVDNVTNQAATGNNIVSSVDLNITVSGDAYYYLAITGAGPSGNSFIIYGARVTFNRASTDFAT